jgi:hypothetical protein
MAQVLKELSRRPRSRGTQYPFDEWLDGKARKLDMGKGKDFECKPKSMAQQIRTRASEQGKSVTVLLYDKYIEVQAHDAKPAEKKAKAKGK